ncbi:MAG: VOC family protein [Planctomycetota bacterium]
MSETQLIAVHPVLPARDVATLTAFYVDRLGFELVFQDAEEDPRYAAIARDGVELHLQWQDGSHWIEGQDRPSFRFLVADPDALFAEFDDAGAIPEGKQVTDTPWGTREFAFYDPDGNALSFYRDL